MTQQHIQANRFVLKGEGLEVTYDETTFAGQPQLTYQVLQGVPSRTFTGNDISSKQSDIGTLVTVTLEVIPDDKRTLFTLVIPTINLTGTNEVTFETLAICTTVRDSIIGPNGVSGAVESYECVQLEGSAQFVTA